MNTYKLNGTGLRKISTFLDDKAKSSLKPIRLGWFHGFCDKAENSACSFDIGFDCTIELSPNDSETGYPEVLTLIQSDFEIEAIE